MASLRYSAADESEDTLNSSHSYTVKDDSGSYAVLTEQSSSASQMTAAKVMDITSRLPGCTGEAADAVSAYTRGKNGR